MVLLKGIAVTAYNSRDDLPLDHLRSRGRFIHWALRPHILDVRGPNQTSRRARGFTDRQKL